MKKIECLICKKAVSNNTSNSYIGSHVKRIHQISVFEYVKKYYLNLAPEIKIEKCGFCDNEAFPHYEIDHINRTYKISYIDGYFCRTKECKNNVSLLIFGNPHNRKQFEHIGANTQYLSLLHKLPIEEVKYTKSKGFRECEWTTSLPNYIEKYGEIEGTIRYKERNIKIGKSNTLSWYIEKYGEVEGPKRYDVYRKKLHAHLGSTKSNSSRIINRFLDEFNIKYIEEYKYPLENKKNGAIDFYLPEHNIAIEYYGDFWHCNPAYYNKEYYHKLCKKNAEDIWEEDRRRINHMFNVEFKKNITILIIWASTKYNDEYLFNLLNEIQGINAIIEI